MDKKTLKNYRWILFFVAVLWLIEIINYLIGHRLNAFGLYPREAWGAIGIFSMHFLHSDMQHLIANSVPLLILGFLVCVNHKVVSVTIGIALTTGLLVWLLGRNGNHVGASGLVMGYFGYLLSAAFFAKRVKHIVLMAITIFVYGGLVFSLIDFRTGISFEGHIFGFIAGILNARVFHSTRTS